jgi:hypothetical protein
MKKMLWAIVLVWCFTPWMPSQAVADDTIYCPTDRAQLQARCDRNGQDMRRLEPKIQNRERTFQDSNNVFFDTALNKKYVMMTRQQLANFISATYGSRNKYAFEKRFNDAINTSNQRRADLLGFGGDLAQAKHKLQQMYIFKSQCCQSALSTGGSQYGNTPPPGRNPPGPGPGGGGNSIRLLDKTAPSSR